MFGFLNVFKPASMTSHDVIAILRKITKIRQIGHAGTLDPFAQGVLPVAIGKATRLIEFLNDDKEYLAEVSFGKSTNTYDCEGEATFECDSKVALKELKEALESFKGEILQTPPIYSAIKIKGKKLYEYARKGEEVEIQPRKVTIEKLELKSFDQKKQTAEILIKCSKGTYIRSIAHDLGQNLKVGAHLSKLIRTRAGDFLVENSIPLEELCVENISQNLIPPLEALNLKKIEITDADCGKIINGQSIKNPETKNNHDDFVILVYNNNVAAIGQVNGEEIKAKKVFT